ncbi:MAG TPA: translation elongation factor Ts [Polyangiaceae bacterium]|nr:translation elongation factor Ts [Polyangiaceae bacterium]
MSAVTPQAIKELRERTQAGMSDCKNALVEAEGEMEKAVEIILKKGLAKSAKRAGAVAAEGEVRAAVAKDLRQATMVEVNIQTDFAARSDGFQKFLGDVVAAAVAMPTGADLKAQPLAGKTVADVAAELSGKIGEKIDVRRWERVEIPAGKNGLTAAYVHMGGKIGVLVQVESESAAAASHAEVVKFADDTAMQIAAMTPLVLQRSEIAADQIEKQKEIFTAQLREDPKPKPEAAWPKIIEGKLVKWYSEVALLEQESVVVPGKTIDQLRQDAGKAAGAEIKLVKFVRFERGEGIAKKEENFAEEVAKMAQS